MVTIEWPYLKPETVKGRVYWYFRHRGKRTRLPGEPGSEEFARAYQAQMSRLRDAEPVQKAYQKHGEGSFGALVKEYLLSPEFKAKRPTTQAEYRRVMEKIADQHGHKLVKDMQPRHVRQMRNERAETPGAANTVVRTLKLLLSWAVENDWRQDNPALRVKLYPMGRWRSWTNEEIDKYKERWAPGTMERRSFALALYTGQRRTDLVAMTRADIRGNEIQVVQSKTGAKLWIKMHTALVAELALDRAANMSLLTTSEGKAFGPVYFGAWFAETIESAGLPDGCVLHGLRKAAARTLADVGCTESEIKSITGHKTSAMIQEYVSDANQRGLASAAIHKLESATKNTRRTKVANPRR